ncbi:NUDIX domain-containing protein [Actinomycetospora succinea]|uniref:NUDIX domain-containing protein n=1 Tax=Actinomycetospora succinea TaxID=663603 RepID=A0A4R6VDP0_9PSEU|nr:CoA pyrophosphatase [Actinomycetospora succinea]TDQ60589.1 NUDIX domain-containing protein [Actinomycetospora succinea]
MRTTCEDVRPDAAPGWLAPLVDACRRLGPDDVPFRRRLAGTAPNGRAAAVLMLFVDDGAGPELLLTERAAEMRSHAGQAAFPGGSIDPEDTGPVGAALREAQEETGLEPGGVVPLVTLPPLTIPVTGFAVTPVLAHWSHPSPVHVVDPGETAAVVRVPVATLADPATRFRVTGPSGYTGPAFAAGGLLVWGFTAGLVDWMLTLGGWARPWDGSDVRDLDEVWAQRHDLSSAHPAPSRPDTAEGGPIR